MFSSLRVPYVCLKSDASATIPSRKECHQKAIDSWWHHFLWCFSCVHFTWKFWVACSCSCALIKISFSMVLIFFFLCIDTYIHACSCSCRTHVCIVPRCQRTTSAVIPQVSSPFYWDTLSHCCRLHKVG